MTGPLKSLFVVIIVTVIGCNSRPTPVAVSGTVTFEGKLLEAGMIQFDPLAGPQTQRRDVAIANGVFELPADKGLLPGTEFKVSIKAFKKTGKKYPNANPGASYDEEIQYLPDQYNVSSTLRATISADVSQNRLKFDLVSK